jgi:beta-glucosidase
MKTNSAEKENGVEVEESYDGSNNERLISSWMEQLTLEEKFRLLSGQSLWALAEVPRLSIPALTVSDGPHGIRKPLKDLGLHEAHPATCFPPACALACSWDEALLERVGNALRDECLHHQVCVLLGPGMNLKRHAGGGRNFEYLSEDPLLSSRLAAAYVRGVQAPRQYNGVEYVVGACIKHYMVNNQESHRFVVDAIVDERTLHELYYRNFCDAVRLSQPSTVMCAYNQLNGRYCSEHPDIYGPLREAWRTSTTGGVVMTDWGATNERAPAIQVGLDLEMPGSHGVHDRSLHSSLHSSRDGELQLDAVDASCRRMLRLIQLHAPVLDCQYRVNFQAHHELAHEAAAECVVLLQNTNRRLPLDKSCLRSVAVVGEFARHSRYQGMGSSQVTATQVSNLMDELPGYLNSSRQTMVEYAPGYDPDDDNPRHVVDDLIDEAIRVARGCDVVLLCVGLPEILESEGFDRTSLQLPAQHNALIRALVAEDPNKVVIILSNGGTIELCDECTQAGAILEGYLLGQAGAAAVADVLFGAVNPSGKLAETMPIRKEDILADAYFPGTRHAVEHREGLDVGYRYFDTASVDVRFPFGHGLSYAEFRYSNLQIRVLLQDAIDTTVEVKFDIQNTGTVAGREVAQCYVRDVEATVYRPVHELRDFAKVLLEPSESLTLTFMLTREAFAFYDIGSREWVVEAGMFEIQIGSSSRDIRLRRTVDIARGNPISVMAQESYPPVARGGTLKVISDDVFAKRFGLQKDQVLHEIADRLQRSVPSSSVPRFHRNSLLKEIAECRLLGRLLLHIVYTEASKEIKPGPTQKRQQKMVRANVENLPLRTLVLFSKGGLTYEGLDTLIALMNHEYCVATRTAIKAIAAAFSDTRTGIFHH